jgi:hypothetical protein
MKGIARILSLTIAILLLSAVLAPAEECGIPVDKTVGPGFSIVEFNNIFYRIYSDASCQLTFTAIDSRYHALTVKPIKLGPMPYCEFSIQWGDFPPVPLGLDSGGSNDFELDTETGYAEKVG